MATLVLAAGESARLGEPKQLIDWGGKSLLQTVVDRALEWPGGSCTVVLGAYAEEILEAVEFADAVVVINEDWDEGMAASLRIGLDAISRDNAVEYVTVGLGDQPGIDAGVVDQLVSLRKRARAIVPKYRYAWGNPVVIDRWLWPRIMALEGDQGAKKLLQAHPEWVHEVWVDALPPRDIDTAADIADLRPRP